MDSNVSPQHNKKAHKKRTPRAIRELRDFTRPGPRDEAPSTIGIIQVEDSKRTRSRNRVHDPMQTIKKVEGEVAEGGERKGASNKQKRALSSKTPKPRKRVKSRDKVLKEYLEENKKKYVSQRTRRVVDEGNRCINGKIVDVILASEEGDSRDDILYFQNVHDDGDEEELDYYELTDAIALYKHWKDTLAEYKSLNESLWKVCKAELQQEDCPFSKKVDWQGKRAKYYSDQLYHFFETILDNGRDLSTYTVRKLKDLVCRASDCKMVPQIDLQRKLLYLLMSSNDRSHFYEFKRIVENIYGTFPLSEYSNVWRPSLEFLESIFTTCAQLCKLSNKNIGVYVGIEKQNNVQLELEKGIWLLEFWYSQTNTTAPEVTPDPSKTDIQNGDIVYVNHRKGLPGAQSWGGLATVEKVLNNGELFRVKILGSKVMEVERKHILKQNLNARPRRHAKIIAQQKLESKPKTSEVQQEICQFWFEGDHGRISRLCTLVLKNLEDIWPSNGNIKGIVCAPHGNSLYAFLIGIKYLRFLLKKYPHSFSSVKPELIKHPKLMKKLKVSGFISNAFTSNRYYTSAQGDHLWGTGW